MQDGVVLPNSRIILPFGGEVSFKFIFWAVSSSTVTWPRDTWHDVAMHRVLRARHLSHCLPACRTSLPLPCGCSRGQESGPWQI